MLTEAKTEVTPVDGYTHYNFATFTGSLYNFFDALRYDRAFLARKADVDLLIQHIKTEHWRPLPSPILLGMYDWQKRAHWTHARLCSGQRLEEVNQVSELYALGSDITATQAKPKLKFRLNLVGFTGTIEEVIRLMYNNRGMPATEKDSHIIEAAYMHPDEPFTVDLTTFSAAKGVWK